MKDPERLSHERPFDGKVFAVDRDRVRLPNGREVTLDVVRHPRSVVLLPIPERGQIVLVRQFRYAVNAFLWELPAGSVDEGETPEQAAARECHEEIAKVPGTVVRLGALFPTPGYCDEAMYFFRLSDLQEPAGAAAVDEDEDIEVRVFRIGEVRDMIRRGEIADMKTIVGLGMV
jgi:ADP-ribose pyrophosphatase